MRPVSGITIIAPTPPVETFPFIMRGTAQPLEWDRYIRPCPVKTCFPSHDGSGDRSAYLWRDVRQLGRLPPARAFIEELFQRALACYAPVLEEAVTVRLHCEATGERAEIAGLTMVGYRLTYPMGSTTNSIQLWAQADACSRVRSGTWLDPQRGYRAPVPAHLLEHVREIQFFSVPSVQVRSQPHIDGDAGGRRIRFFGVRRTAPKSHDLSHTFWHEVGHIIEEVVREQPWVECDWTFSQAWLRPLLLMAAASDSKVLPRPYHRNSWGEHWADAVAEYMKDPIGFTASYPHRAALVQMAKRRGFRKALEFEWQIPLHEAAMARTLCTVSLSTLGVGTMTGAALLQAEFAQWIAAALVIITALIATLIMVVGGVPPMPKSVRLPAPHRDEEKQV